MQTRRRIVSFFSPFFITFLHEKELDLFLSPPFFSYPCGISCSNDHGRGPTISAIEVTLFPFLPFLVYKGIFFPCARAPMIGEMSRV